MERSHALQPLTDLVTRRIGKGVWTFFRKGEWTLDGLVAGAEVSQLEHKVDELLA